MEIFQKAFNRKRKKLHQSGGEPINKLAGTGEKGFPECELHFSNAQKFYKTGDLNNALCAVNKAIELSPVDDWKQYAFKANILGALKMFQEAIHAFEKAIELNSDDVKVDALYHQMSLGKELNQEVIDKAKEIINNAAKKIEEKNEQQNSTPPGNKSLFYFFMWGFPQD